ncbi:aldo/keto reductase [Nesterenkonia sp. Act20]|uniref:aldo/keto reductase n=1 Tax=Nesterenkonia sp. Act20 TaxID=1483432 RepID=UPI001C492AB9|nr:aldo/keto reductase [Nesterenkonia sp. Act20]
MTTVPQITLNNGVTIPQLGYGTFQITPETTKGAVLEAFEVGYRHIDTAQMYGNEAEVGQALKESGLSRDEVFITSKLNNSFHRFDDALSATDESLRALGLEQVDLFLIHWPLPTIGVDYVETWKAMIEIYKTGKARAIGVSNFQVSHLQRLIDETDTVPAVNQIEIHPYLTNEEVRAFDTEHNIATEAWSPIAKGAVLEDPLLNEIAERLDRTVAQVTLRWHIQQGHIVFPKSVTRSRIEENFNLFDFELGEEDVVAISGLNKDQRTGPDPDSFDHIP